MQIETSCPDWVVFHVPHDSRLIPPAVRDQFVLDDDALEREICRMTDHLTFALFALEAPAQCVVRAPVTRLVVDTERFEDDAQEIMAARGMGAVYAVTSQLSPLRRTLSPEERQHLLDTYYRPHHARLTAAVDKALETHRHCLVLDCHSFPRLALPYEMASESQPRPDICIGTDANHTPPALATALTDAFLDAGFTVALNTPFAGAIVPRKHHGKTPEVHAAMLEVRRDLYCDEETGIAHSGFDDTHNRIRRALLRALQTKA